MSTKRRKNVRKSDASADAVILLTGFPSYLTQRVCEQTLKQRPAARIYLLHAEVEAPAVDGFLSGLADGERERVLPLTGDVAYLDLGLTSENYRRLVDELTEVQHLAALYRSRGRGDVLRKVNVSGTREVVELAAQCRSLNRLVHWSTAMVSGTRKGVVLEDELESGQRFHNTWEQTRYEAERVVRRASRKLPVTILRPGVVVGDSRTGELLPYEGPHDLVSKMVAGRRDQPVVLPGSGSAPVHLVPVDFVARAGCHLAADPEAIGQTFHLTDPAPLPAKKVYQLIARKAHRMPSAVPQLVSRLLTLSSRVERLTPFPVAPADIFDSLVFYNCQNTLSFLENTDIRCPSLGSYVEALVRFAKDTQVARPAEFNDLPEDPLE